MTGPAEPLTRIVIKVCGVTEERDAMEAVHLGVDAVGFHFVEDSPRWIEPAAARRIVERLPVFVAKVGVFGAVPLIRVLEVVRQAGLTAVQFDGAEPAGAAAGLAPIGWYACVPVDAGFDPESLKRYDCRTFLLRSRTGEGVAPYPWARARGLSIYGNILIGGGLDPVNVGMAIDDARPHGVDVLESVEVLPGKKDLDRLELFVDAVRRAERRIRDESRRV